MARNASRSESIGIMPISGRLVIQTSICFWSWQMRKWSWLSFRTRPACVSAWMSISSSRGFLSWAMGAIAAR
jgi:hypothetical protein